MRDTGTETLVVGWKVLYWDWTEGASSFSFGFVHNLQRDDAHGRGKVVCYRQA